MPQANPGSLSIAAASAPKSGLWGHDKRKRGPETRPKTTVAGPRCAKIPVRDMLALECSVGTAHGDVVPDEEARRPCAALALRMCYPSASDLCSQLVGNSGIRSQSLWDLSLWQCGLHSARISLSGENIPRAADSK